MLRISSFSIHLESSKFSKNLKNLIYMTETWVAADRTSWKCLICPDEPGLGRKFSGFSENPRTCEGFAINLLGIPHRLVDFLKKRKFPTQPGSFGQIRHFQEVLSAATHVLIMKIRFLKFLEIFELSKCIEKLEIRSMIN